MKKDRIIAHAAAIGTSVVWGTTFVASSMLLGVLTAAQLVLIRFALSYIALWLLSTGRKSPEISPRNELRFLLMGFFGVTGYQLLENTALRHTTAANVGIIIAAAPVFTAILAHILTRDEKLRPGLIIGSLTAFAGVALVTFNGTVVLKLSPLGDCVALCAALCWAIYGMLLKGIVGKYDPVTLTRRTMFYGLLIAAPVVLAERKPVELSALFDMKMILSLALLSLLGSAVCYVTWNYATRRLGTVITTNYLYVSPFITMIAARVVLGDRISLMGFIGAVMIIAGVVIASMKAEKANEEK